MNKKPIFGESEKVWKRKRKRLEAELQEKELPPTRRVEVEANLYFIDCVIREMNEQIKEEMKK